MASWSSSSSSFSSCEKRQMNNATFLKNSHHNQSPIHSCVPLIIRAAVHPIICSSNHPHIRTSVHPYIHTSAHPEILKSVNQYIRIHTSRRVFVPSCLSGFLTCIPYLSYLRTFAPYPFTPSPLHPFTPSPLHPSILHPPSSIIHLLISSSTHPFMCSYL
jgi:hypothetical protein